MPAGSRADRCDDEATLDSFDDGAFDNAIGFLDLLDVSPSALVLCTLLGQNQTAFLVFLGDDKGLNGVADLDDFVRINVLLDGKLTGGDDTLSLVADVEQDLVVIDLDDGTFDQITIIEVLDGGIDCLMKSSSVPMSLMATLATSLLFSAINLVSYK